MTGTAAAAPPRVLLVTRNFPFVSQTFVADQFIHLLARGWDVHVTARHSEDRWWANYPRMAAESAIRDHVHVSDDPGEIMRELDPAVVHFEFGALAIGQMNAAKSAGAASVVSFRGYDINFTQLQEPAYYDDVWRNASMLHCCSEALWQRCQERGCPPGTPHRIIPGGVDLDFFDPGSRPRPDIAGNQQRPLRILSVGRLVWTKGHDLAIKALRMLVDQGIDATLTIIGGGAMADELRFAAWDLGVFDRVHLAGSLPRRRVRAAMKKADVFLAASYSEGFGISVLEAQAMQLPVVCTDADGLKENVVDGETGFVVPRREAAPLADRLALLARAPKLRASMAHAGRERVAQHFRIDQDIDAFEWLYYDAIEAARGASPA
jgi:colanic acid/amylovoran biosynthesis glycosyltransferase